jgi:polysaccharide chain length determinant protein (PEP-CTERM system associated)
MHEVTQQALAIARAMWQRRWIALAAAWTVAVIGSIVVLRIPDRYEAAAKIYVDTQTVLRPLMSGLAVQPDVGQIVSMMARTLITRPNVEKLMRNIDLDLHAGTHAEKDRLVDGLIRDIRLSGGRENLYELSYRDANPDLARKVVQGLVTLFVEAGLGGKRRDAEEARKFIDDQIRSYEHKLQEAENKVKEFKIRNLTVVGDTGQGYVGRVSAMTEEINRARLELRSAEEARDALKRELSGEEPTLLPDTPAVAGSGVSPELDARLAQLNQQLDELSRRYTDEHPDVVTVRRQIRQLEEQKRQQIEAIRKAAAAQPPRATTSTNPVFQRIKISLAEAEANIASLRAKVAELESRLRSLRASAARAPQAEAEYTQLTRDYEILKRNYEQLVARRETASISEDVDAGARFADFRVIDPPRVSPRPVFPNRVALIPAILIGSLGAGLFVAFALSQVFPTVQSVRALRALSPRPVLGSVSMQLDGARVARERRLNVVFGSALGLLVLANLGWTLVTFLRIAA